MAMSPSTSAPWHSVPNRPIISLEHPYLIRDMEKGLKSIGGLNRIQELVERSGSATAKLYLRPGDRMSKPLQSTNLSTNNILLKVTLPKRTGLKRKRGSEGPFYESLDDPRVSEAERQQMNGHSIVKDGRYLVQTMSNKPENCHVQAVGKIEHTHRFRDQKMKGFKFDVSKGVKSNTDIIPPPRFTHFDFQFNYLYSQNPNVKEVVDELGNASTINIAGPQKNRSQPVPHNVDQVPTGLAPDVPPIETCTPAMQRLIAIGRELLLNRPIFTRRALINSIPGNEWETVGTNAGKYMYQYMGYMFSSGPWRDAVVRFGVDPRKDPKYRIYQTMMFMLEKEPKDSRAKYVRTKNDPVVVINAAKKKNSHIFDGKNVTLDGKVWQVCDITDPFLKDLLGTSNLREDCHLESDGWYHNGTWAKVKILMKAKISAILGGVPPGDMVYARIANGMPDIIDRGGAPVRLGDGATSEEIGLASSIRTAALSNRALNLTNTPAGEERDEDGENEI